MKGTEIMPEHDNTTALPDAQSIEDQQNQTPSPEQTPEQTAEQTVEQTAEQAPKQAMTRPEAGSETGSEARSEVGATLPPATEIRQGSGAISASQPVALSVSASDAKAFGASLDDIATGRVTVRFDV
jgi:hypothetical protein